MPAKSNSIDGQIGRFYVVCRSEKRSKSRDFYWTVRCECGHVSDMLAHQIRKQQNKTCGHTSHGKSRNVKHRASYPRTSEYIAWCGSRARCLDPNQPSYIHYGGRGIVFDSRWDDFSVFLRDMGNKPSPSHSIERIDNNGPYSPENCKWAPPEEQARNKRSNVVLDFNGRSMCVSQWAIETHIPGCTISLRIKLGWPIERVLTQPVRRKRVSISQ